jgi:hypothetical protein
MARHRIKVLLLVALALCACDERRYSRAVVFAEDGADTSSDTRIVPEDIIGRSRSDSPF